MHSNMAKIAMGNEQWHLASSVKKTDYLLLLLTSPNSFFSSCGRISFAGHKKKRIDLNLPYLIGFVKKELATVL